MQSSSPLDGTSDCSDGTYSAYLLSYIDLLNHASNGSPEHVTTLCGMPMVRSLWWPREI